MLPEAWQHIERVLVVRLDNLGDVVLTGPALRVLRRALPEATLTLLASRAGSKAAPMLPWIDECLVHRPVWQDISNNAPLDAERQQALIADLRQRRFDAAVLLTSFSQSPYPPAYVCYLAEIPIRLGQSKEFGGAVLSPWIRSPSDSMHQADRNLYLLHAAGFAVGEEDRALELHVGPTERCEAEQLLRSVGIADGEPFVALAPGASCAARRYDIRRYAAVTRLLHRTARLPIVLLGAAHEEGLGAVILDGHPHRGTVSLIGRTTVPVMADVIRRARLVLANDSAAMHVAEAFRRPMVILFSGTDMEEQWEPRRAPARLLRRVTPCRPCYRFQCPYAMECLDIRPRDVVRAAMSLLDQTGDAGRTEGTVTPCAV